MSDMEAEYVRYVRELAHLAERGKSSLILRPSLEDTHEYEIAYNRMNTAPKALDWIRHLTEKDWITPLHIHAFVEAAIEQGAKVYNGA